MSEAEPLSVDTQRPKENNRNLGNQDRARLKEELSKWKKDKEELARREQEEQKRQAADEKL